MFKRIIVLIVICFYMVLTDSSYAVQKKLIEFGRSPETAYMREHIATMEKMPFDGVVFYASSSEEPNKVGDFCWKSWGSRTFTKEQMQRAVDNLKNTQFKKFTDNFLRVCVTPGDVDWFDSFDAVLNNMRVVAWVAKQGGVKGIKFDVEDYEKPLWDYHRQRDAKTKSFNEYAAQVRKRGAEVMNAFQEEYPDVIIMLSFGHSVNYKYGYPGGYNLENPGPNGWPMWSNDPNKLQFFSYGLLSPFIDGMVDVVNPKVKLIDGSEYTYFFIREREFISARKIFNEKVLPFVADKEKYLKAFSLGFGIWMDGYGRDENKDPLLHEPGRWNDHIPTENYWQPAELQMALTNALKYTDEYVWLYNEAVPPNFWAEKPNVPPVYIEAIKNARKAGGLD